MPSIRRFSNQEDCRKAIAMVFRAIESDQIDPAKGRVLIYAALSISNILADHELEKRVEALETNLNLTRRTA